MSKSQNRIHRSDDDDEIIERRPNEGSRSFYNRQQRFNNKNFEHFKSYQQHKNNNNKNNNSKHQNQHQKGVRGEEEEEKDFRGLSK